jgi:hypothetical protein
VIGGRSLKKSLECNNNQKKKPKKTKKKRAGEPLLQLQVAPLLFPAVPTCHPVFPRNITCQHTSELTAFLYLFYHDLEQLSLFVWFLHLTANTFKFHSELFEL